MAKLDLDGLRQKLAEAKTDASLAETAASIISEAGLSDDDSIVVGNFGAPKSEKIQVIVEEIVEKFKQQKSFNWRVHILDVVDAVVDIVKLVDDQPDRGKFEGLVVDVVQDLFRRYDPKIPYLPGFIGRWVKSLIVKTIVPAVVDWIFDRIYGGD